MCKKETTGAQVVGDSISVVLSERDWENLALALERSFTFSFCYCTTHMLVILDNEASTFLPATQTALTSK